MKGPRPATEKQRKHGLTAGLWGTFRNSCICSELKCWAALNASYERSQKGTCVKECFPKRGSRPPPKAPKINLRGRKMTEGIMKINTFLLHQITFICSGFCLILWNSEYFCFLGPWKSFKREKWLISIDNVHPMTITYDWGVASEAFIMKTILIHW